MESQVAKKIMRKGPHLLKKLPLCARVRFVFPYTYCNILVKMQRFKPNVTECMNDRAEAVFICDKPLNMPASNRGQHQLPTSAGIEKSIVQTAMHVDVVSEPSSVSASPPELPAPAEPIGMGSDAGSHPPPTQSEAFGTFVL